MIQKIKNENGSKNKLSKEKISNLINVYNNIRVPLSAKQREKIDKIYPYYGAQGIVDYVDNYLFDGEYLLVAEDGENLRSNNQNICNLVQGKFWVNNHAHILKANSSNNTKYLFYNFNLINFEPFVTGSAQPKLNKENLLNIETFVHGLKDQQKIASILSALDDKIELNNKINENLEQQAKLLYDYWFVQNADESWEVKTLGEIANITMGQSPDGKSYNENKLGTVFYQGSTDFGWRFPTVRQYTTAPTRFAKQRDILLSVRAPVGALNVANENCCIGRGLAALNSKDGFNSYLLYLMSNFKNRFENINSVGTTFGSITKNELHSLELHYPPKEILMRFEEKISIFDNQIFINSQQNQQLSALRDFLLPMLMNGQVKVE